MPPILCDSTRRCSEDERNKQQSPCSQPVVHLFDEDLNLWEPGPFYGMFDRHEENDGYLQVFQTNPRRSGAIPEASETFQRAMRQLDDVQFHEQAPGLSGLRKDAAVCTGSERKLSKVKKSASFSTSPARSSSSASSSSSRQPSRSTVAETQRRMSVPCVRSSSKHVQWADEAGVSELVSVRLIRPRLDRSDKEEAQNTTPSRSILRRLSGMR